MQIQKFHNGKKKKKTKLMTAFLAEFTKETKAFLFSLFSAYCLRKIYFNATTNEQTAEIPSVEKLQQAIILQNITTGLREKESALLKIGKVHDCRQRPMGRKAST